MNTPNPNVCPTCGSRNTGATFGWEPQRVNADETILTGVGFAQACQKQCAVSWLPDLCGPGISRCTPLRKRFQFE
jgi:hypothetical protein